MLMGAPQISRTRTFNRLHLHPTHALTLRLLRLFIDLYPRYTALNRTRMPVGSCRTLPCLLISNIGTFTQAELPPSPKAAPRLPSFDLTQKNDTSEDLWFSNEIGLKRNSNDRLAPSISPPVFEEDTSPGIQSLAITEGGDGDESAIADEGMYRSGMYRSSPKRWWE
jgi:hypothetical protein